MKLTDQENQRLDAEQRMRDHLVKVEAQLISETERANKMEGDAKRLDWLHHNWAWCVANWTGKKVADSDLRILVSKQLAETVRTTPTESGGG